MRTESNVRPSARLEIEALPKIEGIECTVILIENIEGPYVRETATDETEAEQYFIYDRYTVSTAYRDNLEESVEENFDAWLQSAKEAEKEGTPLTELEILQKTVKAQEKAMLTMNKAIDDLVLQSLEGGDLF